MQAQNIFKVYSGKIGCMCGCNGKYSYTPDGAVNQGPGYDVSDSVSERSVKIIAKKVLSNPAVKFEENFAYVEDRVANRIRVVYFN